MRAVAQMCIKEKMDKVVPSESGTVTSLKTVNEAGWLAQIGGGGWCVYGCFEGRLDIFFIFYFFF